LKNQEFAYFWDRATGNIFENLSSSTIVSRISNFTLPRMEEALFIDGFSVLVRGVLTDNESITTKYISLYKETATSTLFSTTLKNLFIPAKQVSLLPSLKKVFYFTPKTGNGVSSSVDGTGVANIIKTSLTEWLVQYVNKDTIAITTRPSAYFPGYLFFVSTNGSGNNQYILGDKYAFTTLTSPNGQKVLYSEIVNNKLETSVFDVKTRTSITLSQATLTEKCAWADDSILVYCGIPQQLVAAPFPDAWYQNLTQFEDNIWSINPSTGEFQVVIPLQDQVTVPIDAFNLKISKTKKYLLFQDRYSLTLWKYEL
jgi:hypothetical protein